MATDSYQVIINARLPGYQELQKLRLDSNGAIAEIASMKEAAWQVTQDSILDMGGDWLSLGGIDLQINGGLGVAFPELKKKDLPLLQKICEYLWQSGIDAFLPTIVTTSVENIQRALSVIDDFMAIQTIGQSASAKIMGVHLEGPFLNYEKRGAHPAQYLLTPTVETVQWILNDSAPTVKLITLAPELDPTNEVIPYLKSQGIRVSLGHSQATAEEAETAFKLGASMVTHAFNAMPPLHHRQPGLLGAAIVNPNVYCGVIADGQHVCPMMLELLLRSSDYEKGIFLVSDALSPIGLPDGIYPWDDRQIQVSNGAARLASGTLAGTTLPLLAGVENLVKWGICPPGTAIALATESPRKAMGLPGISVGQPADLLRWHWEQETAKLTWKRLNFS
jgi:N-acetylglucosamine-6-phosphate deacetylase